MKIPAGRQIGPLAALTRGIIANNAMTFAGYAIMSVIDGLLIAWVATTIAPLADFVIDPTFAHASSLTHHYIDALAWLNLHPTLGVLLTLFVVANAIKAASTIILYHFTRKFAYVSLHDLTSMCLGAFLSSSLVFFLSHPIGTLQNTLQKECEKLSDGIAAFITIAAVGVQILMLAAVAWSLSHTMVIICVALVAVFVMITRWLDRSVRHFAALTTATANGITQSIMESLSGAKLILAAGRGRVMLQRYSDAYRKHAGYAVKAQVVANAIPSLYQAFGIFSVSLALYVSLHRGENLSTLIAALWTLLRVVPLFTQLITNVTTTSNVVPSFAQYSGLIREAEAAALPSGGIALASLKQDIEFERVSFGYPGRRTALDQVTLTIPKGSFTAFVGDSGSGKTTTVDILLRLLVPDSGRVSIDGIDLAGYDLGSLLDRVAYVQQDSFLFHASIRENLLWAKPDASTAELWDALRLANIDEFVRSLPSTLDTLVGDRGMALSGGQRQRIALARALVKKPDILILDEATSALDSESERLIMKSIDAVAPYTTIIAVAHRLSTVARADLVYVFSAGTIVEAGPYARLRETPGSRLRELISAQQGGLVA